MQRLGRSDGHGRERRWHGGSTAFDGAVPSWQMNMLPAWDNGHSAAADRAIPPAGISTRSCATLCC